MNFGFDIDGTLTAAPEALIAIAEALMANGHQVHVLTGTMDPVAIPEHYARRREQLTRLGLPSFTKLHIVTAPHAQAKADYCRAHDIVLMFEDSVVYADAISEVTTCFMIHPRKNP